MSQVFYVSIDEEILSIVGRLRSSRMLENVFVVPKRALLLGSGVNLRLLAREAEKSGKRVIIVTQDEEGRILAEKAGLSTKPYSEELFREGGSRERSERAAGRSPEVRMSEEDMTGRDAGSVGGLPVESLGSDSFFASADDSGSGTRPSDGLFRSHVREASPKRPSIRLVGKPSPSRREVSALSDSEGRLSRLFGSASGGSSSRVVEPRPDTPRRVPVEKRPVRSDGHSWFLFFVGVSLLFLFATGALILLPKASIDIVPKSASKSKEISFVGKIGAATGEQEVPVRITEYSDEVSVMVDATGTPSSSGQKATGSVVIYNAYNASPQPLVATTRLETSDGKVFRLAKGITVPGMTSGGEPGVVEVSVVADEIGESYNIGPSEFTIPGFRGNPKFDAFSAKSTETMRGGTTGGGDGVATVSEADLKRAREEAEHVFRERFETELGNRTEGDERFVGSSEEVVLSGAPIAPEPGFATASFEYRATFVGKAFLFSEGELKRKAERILDAGDSFGKGYAVEDMTVEYLSATPAYESGEYPIPVRVTALFVADTDLGELRDDLLGKRLDEVESVLRDHPEIERLDISWPLPTALPKKVRQYDLRILGAEG